MRPAATLIALALLWGLAGEACAGLLGPGHGGGGAAWGLAECAACHPLGRIHGDAPNIREPVRRHGYGTCTGCHGDNGTGRPRACQVCHNPADLPASPRLDGFHRHDLAGSFGDPACVACHLASDMDGRFEPDVDLSPLPDAAGGHGPYHSVSDFCVRCHNRDHQQPGFEIQAADFRDPRVAMEDNDRAVDHHGARPGGGGTYAGLRPGYGYPERVPCTDCHAMHGTNNPGLLIDSSAKGVSRLDPLLRGGAIPVWVQEGDYAELCVLCHAMDEPLEDAWRPTGNGLSGVHQSAGDCRPCHGHGLANQAGL